MQKQLNETLINENLKARRNHNVHEMLNFLGDLQHQITEWNCSASSRVVKVHDDVLNL